MNTVKCHVKFSLTDLELVRSKRAGQVHAEPRFWVREKVTHHITSCRNLGFHCSDGCFLPTSQGSAHPQQMAFRVKCLIVSRGLLFAITRRSMHIFSRLWKTSDGSDSGERPSMSSRLRRPPHRLR